MVVCEVFQRRRSVSQLQGSRIPPAQRGRCAAASRRRPGGKLSPRGRPCAHSGLVDPALLGAVSAGRRDVRASGRQGGGTSGRRWGLVGAAGSRPGARLPESCSPPLWSLRDSLRYLGDSLGKRGRHHPPVKPLEVLLERLLLRAVIWLSR